MIAYKGFNGDLTCTYGKGKFQYHIGETIQEEASHCARSGLHCAENPLDCLQWYPLGGDNRYCVVEAEGSIDEDGADSKIACTRMTIVRELTVRQLAAAAAIYMVQHPLRAWERTGYGLEVKKDSARGTGKGSIAIARGRQRRVRGAAGSVMVLMREQEPGCFEDVRVLEAGKDVAPETWYAMDDSGNLQEVNEDETEESSSDRAG